MPHIYEDSSLVDFIDEDSWLFFQLTRFEPSFLSKPAKEWKGDANFQSFCQLVDGFTPLNDAAERVVKFASDINNALTRDADRRKEK